MDTPEETGENLKTVNYADFAKLDIKIGRILSAEKIEGADKLLKLEVDFGSEKRQIVAGIAKFYTPEQLINKLAPFIVNLEPRKLRGIESHGMIIVAQDKEELVLISPEKDVLPGSGVG